MAPLSASILIPVFNDYAALTTLLGDLERTLRAHGRAASILVVDDGSAGSAIAWRPPSGMTLPIRLLRLRRNLGHQRAIAIGLAYVHAHLLCDALVIMDADGEDRPEDVPRLIAEFERRGLGMVVFAERTRRSERRLFLAFYHAYRLLHRALTGIPVRFGNFSVVPRAALSSLVVASELWNHYAAAVLKIRLPYTTIPTARGRRLSGRSSLGFVPLVVHGLSAISVFGDVIGVRLAVASFALMTALIAAIAALAVGSWTPGASMPLWLLIAGGALAFLVCQVFITSCIVMLLVLGSRASTAFIPLRDYEWFVQDCVELWPTDDENARVLVSGG